MLLEDLHDMKEQIEALAGEFGARHIRVFGSVARGEETPDSDVDFLVDFPKGYDLFGQRIPLTEQLKGILGRNVDLIPEHELNPYLSESILKEAVEL